MKLCKDCKHALMPNPYRQLRQFVRYFPDPMCCHPSAGWNVVDGSPVMECERMRGKEVSHQGELICGHGAKLFEERAAQAVVEPERTPYYASTDADSAMREAISQRALSFLKRVIWRTE